jgi:hypothetical protein
MPPEVPWLRLVYDARWTSSVKVRRPEQMSLPYAQSDIILLLNTKKMRSQSFLFALGSVRPHWVFDLRYNPRLDVLAGSRLEAFRHFDDLDVHYIDVFGLMDSDERKQHVRRKRRFVTILRHYLSRVADNNGPYLALLDDDDIMDIVTDSAQNVISTLTGRQTSLSQLAISSEISN